MTIVRARGPQTRCHAIAKCLAQALSLFLGATLAFTQATTGTPGAQVKTDAVKPPMHKGGKIVKEDKQKVATGRKPGGTTTHSSNHTEASTKKSTKTTPKSTSTSSSPTKTE